MQTLTIRNTVFGDGTPKICVPITGKSKEEIFQNAAEISLLQPDCMEWRIDWFENYSEEKEVLSVLKELRKTIGSTILIATFRTLKEGGKAQLPYRDYEKLNVHIAKTGFSDLIDVEAFSYGEISENLIDRIHLSGTKVIGSSHDFNRTPSLNEMINRLRKLQNMNADIPKLSVMPKSTADVLNLMMATNTMVTEYANRPIITMAMAGIGCISRMTGELFGSAVTFASVGQSSAPGQPDITSLRAALSLIHNTLV